MGVQELDKPEHTVCSNQCATGCAIYNLRPAVCQIYECMWLRANIIDEDLRPDKCGIIFDVPVAPTIPHMIIAREVWEGALETKEADMLLKAISQKWHIYVILVDGKRRFISTDPEVAKQAEEMINQHNSKLTGGKDA